MTIQKLINKVQEEKPNSFQTEKLIEFINEVEAEAAEQVNMDIPVYTVDDLEEELIVPAPYDQLYVSYLKAKIDYANEELESYANNQAQYSVDFDRYENWTVRTGQTDKMLLPSRFKNIF